MIIMQLEPDHPLVPHFQQMECLLHLTGLMPTQGGPVTCTIDVQQINMNHLAFSKYGVMLIQSSSAQDSFLITSVS